LKINGKDQIIDQANSPLIQQMKSYIKDKYETFKNDYLPPEYLTNKNDEDHQIFLKGYQRQINFHKIANKNPIIIEADPKIQSLYTQP
jgi:hypothetical protein